MARLILGCGGKWKDGWLLHDRYPRDGLDYAFNLNDIPWPLPDKHFNMLEADSVLEHLDDVIAFMNECWRVLVLGGSLELIVPDWQSSNAWKDPTHKRAFTIDSFYYFDSRYPEYHDYGKYYGVRPWSLEHADYAPWGKQDLLFKLIRLEELHA